jgi:hypothetical protein
MFPGFNDFLIYFLFSYSLVLPVSHVYFCLSLCNTSTGDILVWEYRTIHRGTRNQQQPRPMLYRTYHLEGSWEDINMGETSFFDTFAAPPQ